MTTERKRIKENVLVWIVCAVIIALTALGLYVDSKIGEHPTNYDYGQEESPW